MKLNVFVCNGGFLVSPDCMLAPQQATEAYWPVSAIVGVVDCNELPSELCAWITRDIDAKQFSFVSTAEAVRVGLPMLASQSPFDEAGQLHPRPGAK